ncbi:glycosyltransferase family 2 protein [Acidiplasma sp.]|uniref:glycosyltransferase family 2 protein n=1 Tax=Acidiplasma sp. TaxID=1872114 RepID=UPI00259065D2|nr:glycosyltransferase family 2 protein [Acidiplasma sp.]
MPSISVLLFAYNRKDFLKDSLNSLASQKFKDFEVILISNFSFDLSNYTNLNVRQIITDGIIENYIYLGIKNAGSDIIVFMDDDDIFLPEKLEFIYNEFSSKNIGYIHNNSLFFSGNIKNASYRQLGRKPDFNMSSISVNKNILMRYLEQIKKVSAAQDTFIYLCALDNSCNILNTSTVLTYYREHQKNTSRNNYCSWLKLYLNNIVYFQNIFDSRRPKKHLKRIYVITRFTIFSRGFDKTPPEFIYWIYLLFFGFYSVRPLLVLRSFLKYFKLTIK